MSSSYTSNSSSPPSPPSNPAHNSTSSFKRRRRNPLEPVFTPLMQDRQARNKDPYSSTDDSEEFNWEPPNKRFDAYGSDTYENIQKRREAAVILDNAELLMLHSMARFDSIPGTRHHFTKVLCGYDDKDDKYGEPTQKSKANQGLKPIKVHGKFVAGSSSASTGPAQAGEGSGS